MKLLAIGILIGLAMGFCIGLGVSWLFAKSDIQNAAASTDVASLPKNEVLSVTDEARAESDPSERASTAKGDADSVPSEVGLHASETESIVDGLEVPGNHFADDDETKEMIERRRQRDAVRRALMNRLSDDARGYSQHGEVRYNSEETEVGYFRYEVLAVNTNHWFRSKFGSEVYAEGKFKLIKVKIVNVDSEPHVLPTFRLVDSSGKQFAQSGEAHSHKDAFGAPITLNPELPKEGTLVFDVPDKLDYALKVSGGEPSTRDAVILFKRRPVLEDFVSEAGNDFAKANETPVDSASEKTSPSSSGTSQSGPNLEGTLEPSDCKAAIKVEDRLWRSADGRFSVTGQLVSSENGKVTIKKNDGNVIIVELYKLSLADRQYVGLQH